MSGRLEKIWIKRAKLGPMDERSEARLEAGTGLHGNADQGGRRQVTIICQETWQRVCQNLGVAISPFARRANLMVSGLDLVESRGRILAIGKARLRIEGETRPCYRMDEAHHGLQEALKPNWGGGVYCTVIESGDIGEGDTVSFSTESPYNSTLSRNTGDLEV
jgi:MOSC domain-containing protein YiiM